MNTKKNNLRRRKCEAIHLMTEVTRVLSPPLKYMKKNKNKKEEKGIALVSAIMCINAMLGMPQSSVQTKDCVDFYKRCFG